jgi:hypothetical protein
MKKSFINCDVTAVLQEIVGRFVKHYQSDFDVDKKIFLNAVNDPDPESKHLLWLARPNGTHCLCERDVYVFDTYENNTWRFYNEQVNEPISAYAIELKKITNGVITGNLHELDYAANCEHVKRNALPIKTAFCTYGNGDRSELDYNGDGWCRAKHDPDLRSVRFVPADMDAWMGAVAEARQMRSGERYIPYTADKLKTDYARAAYGTEM